MIGCEALALGIYFRYTNQLAGNRPNYFLEVFGHRQLIVYCGLQPFEIQLETECAFFHYSCRLTIQDMTPLRQPDFVVCLSANHLLITVNSAVIFHRPTGRFHADWKCLEFLLVLLVVVSGLARCSTSPNPATK